MDRASPSSLAALETPAGGVDWSARLLTGDARMDSTHEEFAQLLNQILALPQDQQLPLFQTFLQHTQEHFAQEDRWMQATGFTADNCHTEQHQMVLETMQSVVDHYQQGQADMVKYMMDGDETGDATDDFGGDISADGDNFDAPTDDEHGHEEQEDSAIMDIKNAIAELEAAFAELEQAQGGEEAEMGMDSEFDDEEDADEMMGMPMENRRVTREYVEKVNHNYGGNTQKQQGQYAGAGTGEKQSSPVDGKSPVSSGKGKPTTGASASNIVGDQSTGEGTNVGTSPAGKAGGLSPEKGEFSGNDWQTNSAPGGKAGVKNLKKVGAGYPGNNKTAGPVGSGTGDKAGQTSVSSDKPLLKKL